MIPNRKFAVGWFEFKMNEYEQAWNSMSLWVPESNFELREGHYQEIYHNDVNKHPEGRFIVDICKIKKSQIPSIGIRDLFFGIYIFYPFKPAL